MVRVLIVDHNRLTCDMFSAVLDEQPDIQVVGAYTIAEPALVYVGGCDVVLLSTNLPEDGAYRLTQTLSRGNSNVRILIIGLSETNKAIIRYIEAGAHGYVRREDSVDDLLANIRSIHQGKAILTPDLAANVIERLAELASYFEDMNSLPSQIACLTPREREVLRLISMDYTNRDIANNLIIEVGTVKNHVHNILSKLEVSSRHEAAGFLSSVGLPVRQTSLREAQWVKESSTSLMAAL